eukprot:2847131-Prymnesium_polylepis.1
MRESGAKVRPAPAPAPGRLICFRVPPPAHPALPLDHILSPLGTFTRDAATASKFQQSYYNDHHESDMVIKDRLERYIPEMDRDERRQPLWVQLTLAEYNALAAATVKGKGELPHGYRYEVASGGGGRTRTQMVELHVDDSDHFDSIRAASPLGGSFS